MPRRFLIGSGGMVFHVMNRGARRQRLFFDRDDYRMFFRAMVVTGQHVPMRVLCYAVMPNHFHMALWPRADGDLSRYMQRLTRLHAQWWQLAHGSVGTGAVYQGRYRAIPVQDDRHLLTMCAYIERNPIRGGLVRRAREWEWGSAWAGPRAEERPALSEWPLARPADWAERLDVVMLDTDDGLRSVIRRSVPFGSEEWTSAVAERLKLTGRLRGPGAPPGGGRN